MRYLLCLTIFIFLISCEKDITVDLPLPESKIVIEGGIETGSIPIIFLSKNAAYFSPVDSASLAQYIIHDAVATISDGITTDTLIEFVAPGNIKTGYYFSIAMIGVAGRTYTLNVAAEGKKVWASTKIPEAVKLDSISFKPDNPEDSLGRLYVHLSDPDTLGNYYRVKTQRTNLKYNFRVILGFSIPRDYYPTGNSVYEDRIFNGKSFEIRLSRGAPASTNEKYDFNRERGRFKIGDTINVKWMSISKEVYDFWRTAEVTINNNGNPFAAPVTIRSNIKGGLGIWAGYGVSTTQVIAR